MGLPRCHSAGPALLVTVRTYCCPSGTRTGLAVLPEKLKGGAAKAAVAKLTALGFLKEVRVSNYPREWRDRYAGENFLPIAALVAYAVLPVDWAEVDRSGLKAREFFAAARASGLGPNGLSFPSSRWDADERMTSWVSLSLTDQRRAAALINEVVAAAAPAAIMPLHEELFMQELLNPFVPVAGLRRVCRGPVGSSGRHPIQCAQLIAVRVA